MDIEGKVALVTGGSRGIGAAVAERLARDGADIALTYRNNADDVVERIKGTGRRVVAIRADSGDPAAVEAAVAEAVGTLGRLDILVNNAAEFLVGPVEQLGVEEFDRTFDVNVRAPFLAVKAALPHLGAGGRIVSIGSNVAERAAFPGFSLYSASKAALLGLTKALGRELGPRGITANLVCPGATATDLNPEDHPMAGAICALTSVGRYGQPDEIASAVAYLVSDEARYVTGTQLAVDGGFTS
ncbi:3-oxoacyl-ACP reductase family protein [Actinosynnema sp. NPDC050436]|uniref:SDR family NAD(P)-dependent oxidoreductase n=1 Tax=Actinosynnema sp. NPDC050436 TaxID=3155659 RepID=UPI0034061FA5